MQPWFKSAALAIALGLPVQGTADQAAGDRAAVFVETTRVAQVGAHASRQFFGQIAALETVSMSFEVSGYLTELTAREGQMLAQGTRLARLDPAPFQRAVERAELELAQAERALIRARALAERNVASAVQAQDAETARDLAEVALREAHDALHDAEIAAPFDGLIAERIGTTFSTIEPGQPILRLHNMSEIRVEFDLPERVLAQIGDPSTVVFTGQLTGTDTRLPLEFREFQAETVTIGQSYTVSLAVETPQANLLLPGRTLIVQATLPVSGDAVRLPATAIASAPDGQRYVVIVDPTGAELRARHHPVGLASSDGTTFTTQDLQPGTEIVAIGAHLIADGQPIKRFDGLTQQGL